MMPPSNLSVKQNALKAKQQPHRGRLAKAEATGQSVEIRELAALLLLKRGMSVARVAADKRIQLSIEQVKRFAAILTAVEAVSEE